MTRTPSGIRAWVHGGVPAALLIFVVAALAGVVRVRLRWWILVPFVAVQAVLAGLTVERLSTIYRDFFFAFPTGNFENRNTALTLVLLGVAVVLAFVGAASSRTRRAPMPRPAAGIRGAAT